MTGLHYLYKKFIKTFITMGFLDFLFGAAKNVASSAAHDVAYTTMRRAINKATDSLEGQSTSSNIGGATDNSQTIVIGNLPRNLAELKAMPQAALASEFDVAALCVAALCNFNADRNAAVEMINYLRGPRPLSNYDIQFLGERLNGKQYKTFSFFNGTSPANEYTPSEPLSINVSSNPYSYTNEGYANLWLHSSGADSPMPISLRKKPSTGQWYVWEMTFLADIREPDSQDPWK